jgi:uncharacterized protein (TIGR02466 family)
MIIDIFKTSIYKTSVHNLDYYNYFINLLNNSLVKKEGRTISNKGGFQTKNFIFDINNSENKNIVYDLFINPVYNFISSFKQKKEITITSCEFWINKNFPKSFNCRHIHASNMISGVYYLEVPINSGAILFENGDNCKLFSENSSLFDGPNFYCDYKIQPKKFDLLLFFSETIHSVEPNFSNEDRISVAFNIKIN